MIEVRVAHTGDAIHALRISEAYAESARSRGMGIAFRAESYIQKKMGEGDGVVAFVNEDIAGFCYIETFENKKYVSNSGLIILPQYREMGLAKRVKDKIFNLSRDKYPSSKIFSITTSGVVLKMNSDLGYRPVAFSELTSDDEFWANCQTCRNFDVLTRNDRKLCLCTGMIYEDKEKKNDE